MLQQPDRGDDGAIPDPNWHTRWQSWPREQIDDYLGQVATWGPLKPEQSIAILQGLPPPPSGWPSLPIVGEEYAAVVDRFQQDVERGAIPACPTPNELAAWADAMKVDLPEPFVDALRQSSCVAEKAQRAPQAVEPIEIPPWVPLVPTNQSDVKAKPRVGRPRTAKMVQAALAQEGTQILMTAANAGKLPKLNEIARELSRQPSFSGFSPGNIARRLSGKLPFRQARTIAEQYARQRRGPRGAARPRSQH